MSSKDHDDLVCAECYEVHCSVTVNSVASIQHPHKHTFKTIMCLSTCSYLLLHPDLKM